MSSRLEQAMKRLEDAVTHLEQAPISAPIDRSPADAPSYDATAIKAEIAEIRSIVAQAMDVLDAPDNEEGQVG